MNIFYSSRLLSFFIFIFFTALAMGQNFNSSGLIGESVSNPTSLQFGPNGKLYVSQQNGTLWEFTVTRDGAAAGSGTYTATGAVQINNIKNGVPNHNDDGSISTLSTRQVTGLYAAGTSAIPVLYVSSSDSRIGGSSTGTDTNLDTNSGVLSRLTWNGSGWDRVDLVRGLPRCEENHSSNGMDVFQNGGSTYMLLQQGGNTNEGGPSNNFAGTSDTYLSGALLLINLTQLESMTIYTDPRSSTSYIYDLPTLNDPTRADITNSDSNFPYPSGHPMYNATIDVGDPFGGNDSRNQAFAEAGAPVQIFSPGYRNAYDVVVTDDGRIFSGDNGSNDGWGGPPVIRTSAGALKGDQSTTTYNPGAGDYVTNEFNLSIGATDIDDGLHYVGTINDANNTYYAGHPVPIRAFPSRAEVRAYVFDSDPLVSAWVLEDSYDWANLIVGVSGYFNTNFTIADFPDDTRQGEFLAGAIGNANVNILDLVNSSTNGMCEYTATNFSSAMVGNLLTASFNGSINRYELDVAGTGLSVKDNSFLSGFGSTPLDVIAQGDTDVFPGTIWSVTYGANNITVFEPADFGTCLQPGETGYDEFADSDSDGYSNGDEVLNGTDHCNGGSKPNDNDLDLLSDLIDPDDDNDGILDMNDVFAIDANNGTTSNLPINYPFWNNDPGTGFGGIGFTGWMINGTTDYLDQYDLSNLNFGGAGGKATISLVPEGDALDAANSQQNGFQFGVNVDVNSPVFTIHTEIETPFGGLDPLDSQSYGVYLGNGDQDNYMKVVVMDGVINGDGISGFEVLLENGGTSVSNTFDAPNLIAANAVDIYISVNPAANTAQPFYSLNSGLTIIQLGSPISLPASFLNATDNTGMAVGIISTSDGPGPEFNATWDFINVTEDGPAAISIDPNPVNFGTLALDSGVVQIVASAFNTGGPSSGAVQITNITLNGTDAALFNTSAVTPTSIGPGSSVGIPINFTPNSIAGAKTANLVITHSGTNSPLTIPLNAVLSANFILSRINAGGQEVTATDGNMNWEFNADTGAYVGTTYSVNNGLTFNSGLTYANKHPSIPASIDQVTFDALFAEERYKATGAADMNFSVPVPNGTYTVNLFMGNSFAGTSQVGERIFDIALEGITIRDNLDLISEFGHLSGGMISLQTDVTDGVLNIVFLEEIQSPLVNAIEVVSGGSQFSPIVIQTVADINNYEGDSGTFLSVGATGGDPLENPTYSISGQPAGVDIESTNGQVFGTIAIGASTGGPSGNGIYSVTVTATKPGSNPDTETFTWSILSDLWVLKNENQNYTARHENSFVQAGNKFYLMGGRENAQTVDVYDYTSDSWVNLTGSAPAEFNHFQATEYQGLIWVIGAFGDNGFPSEVPEEFIWAFDPATNDWIQGPQIPAARRRGSTGLVVQNNKFYIVGGNTIGHSGGYVPWFDEYDPATGVWTPLADAPRARDHFNAAVIGNELYVAGGRLSGGAGGTFAPTIAEVDVYNFGSNSWSTLPAGQNIPTPRGGAAVVNFDDKLVVIGGEVENQVVYGTTTTDALPITEEYNPATQTWTRLDDLNNERHGTQAISSGLGIFILGGSPDLGGGNQKIMEYLGSDNPVGVASASSTFSAPASVTISDGTSEDVVLNVGNGNVGVFVTSMAISGPDAADFTITSGELTNQLLSVNSTHTTTVNLGGTGANRSAILTINYSDGEAITVNLANFDSNLNVGNPGTQNNNEGDVVSLQIQATGASNYTATGLPPTLTINPTTGLISGTVSSGGGNTGPFEEQNGLVVIEAESGTIVNNWTQTTTGGATGIIAGADHLNNQNGGTIPYQVTVTTPGVYRFNWRSFYSGASATDENDNWLRFPNNNDVWFFGFKGTPVDEASLIANVSSANPTNIVFPIGSSRITATTTPEGNGGNGYFKIYRAGGASEVYDWQAKTSDNDSHDVYVWFANPGTFTMEISERSAGHAIDKVALYKLDGTNYTDAQLTAANESQRSGGIGAADNSPYTVTVSVEDNGNPPSTANTQFTWYIGQTGDPIANAEASPINGLIPLDVNFTGSNSTDDVAVTSYLWDFKDGSATVTDPDPMHTFTVAGTYEVELTVEDGDGNQSTTTVTITASNPSAADDILINSGGPALTFDGDNWSADTNFIGGDIFEKIIPIENTLNDQLYQTERYGPSGSTIVYEIPVAVNGEYNVDLHFAELFFGLPGNGSAGGVGSRVFNVDIENGQEQLTNYDIFEVAGEGAYAIVESFKTVTVNDGNLTITLTAVVENPKISGIGVFKTTAPEVNAGMDQTITLPTNSAVLNGIATDADGGAIAAYLWTQESGPSTATLVAANTADLTANDLVEGTYVFRLTATDDENAIGFDDVTVIVQPEGANMAPTAVVSATPLTGDSPLEVTFTGSNSTDDVAVVSYAWDFMDGNTSIDADPIHTFTADGSYAVELTVTDAEGLTDTAIVTITVGAASNMAPTAIATATPLTGDVPLEVTFTGSNSTDDVAVVTYAWDFQDGNTSIDADPVYTFTAEGTYEVELTVTDAEGLTDIATVTIIVGTAGNQAPTAIAEATPTAGDPPLEVSFTGSNSTDDVAVVTYAWDFMDGTTSAEADPVHTFTADGLYNVELTVTDAEGLTDTAIVSIAVGDVSNLPPVAVIEAEPFGEGAPLIVQFTGSNSTDDFSIESYEWDFGDATAGSTEVNPEHIYTLPGMYTVSLTVTDAEGLTNTATFDIVVLEGTKLDILLEANPPNPSDGGIVRVIVVNQPESVEVINITIHDIGGRYVAGHRASDIRVNNMYEVPVSTYRNGVYLVRVVMSDGESTLLKLFVAN